MKENDGRDKWIEVGLKEIGRAGVEGVRVEVLAERLGITKGGFYRRFKDRRALLDALLENWTRGRITAIEAQTRLAGEDARERLKSVIRLYSERLNPQGMAIELAIRQWRAPTRRRPPRWRASMRRACRTSRSSIAS